MANGATAEDEVHLLASLTSEPALEDIVTLSRGFGVLDFRADDINELGVSETSPALRMGFGRLADSNGAVGGGFEVSWPVVTICSYLKRYQKQRRKEAKNITMSSSRVQIFTFGP